jgi:hypothetical protein
MEYGCVEDDIARVIAAEEKYGTYYSADEEKEQPGGPVAIEA